MGESGTPAAHTGTEPLLPDHTYAITHLVGTSADGIDAAIRNGITKASLPIGTEIKLFGYQAKSGESKGVGVFVEYLDGRKVFMGGSAPGASGKGAATVP